MRRTTNPAVMSAALLAAGLLLTACAAGTESAAAPATAPLTQDGAFAETGDGLDLAGFWVKESSLDLAAGYGTISNAGPVDDRLIGASAPGVPMIELHQTVDGVMRQVPAFPIPADGSLVLEPGANHLMFTGLTEPLSAGGQIELTLKFESGASATVTAPIKSFESGAGVPGAGEPGAGESGDGHTGHKH